MDPEDNDYEIERQKTIAENRALLDSLGFEEGGTAKLNLPKPVKPAKSKPAPSKKRKSEVSSVADDGPRRRSGRIAGLEADGEALKIKLEEEEKEREVIRIINRKEREQVMDVDRMVEDSNDAERADLNSYLSSIASCSNARRFPPEVDEDPFPTKGQAAEVARLKECFKNMSLKANAKVTPERSYCMIVHPQKSKTLVFSGDKHGMLGIWDALGPSEERVKDEDDTADVKPADEELEEGRVWHVQAHARNAITCMKVDPINGSSLFTSSYDCSLRNLSFESCITTELFAFNDEDMLITHFDLDPSGQQAWISDRNGGISHCDFREGKNSRRRWVVQDEGRAAKLGGISVNPRMPHLLVTAGNDQHLRIWDTRCLFDMPSRGSEHWDGPTTATAHINGNGDTDVKPRVNNAPTENFPPDKVTHYMETKAGKGLLRASYQHGKSCSAAYWDPWGKRVLTTSYDDKLRVWTLPDESLNADGPLAPTHFQPSKTIPHNCQTGRWLTILRAQWSLNMDFIPHFTIGNMKRTLDVVACTGDKICQLWTDGVSAVPAVTASHPNRVDHVLGANTSGRVQLWTSDA